MRELRLAAFRERLDESLWFFPALAVAVALLVGFGLGRVDLAESGTLEVLLFSGDSDSARVLLATLLGALVTVTGVVLSITVVALQIASQQFSPRLLRRFLKDRGTQVAISILMGTYGYLLAVLQTLPFGSGPAPDLAVSLGLLLALVSLFTLVYFIHDITRGIRVEVIMQGVEREAAAAIRRVFPSGLTELGPQDALDPPPDAHPLLATGSGYLQAVDLDALVAAAEGAGAVVRLRPRIDDHVAAGSFLGWVWPLAPGGQVEPFPQLAQGVADGLQLGFERSLQQDATFGLGQLVDMAVKALSPAVNDPRTAVEAVHHLEVLLCELGRRQVHWLIGRDAQGRARAIVERHAFPDYLALACDQIRRFGAAEPVVDIALLDMLANCSACVDSGRRELLLTQVDLVEEAAEQQMAQKADLVGVRRAAREARERIEWLCSPSPHPRSPTSGSSTPQERV